MDYVSAAEAISMSGLRLVLPAGSPGPWAEAAKEVLRVRNVDFVAVARIGFDHDPELFAWTGQNNAPVAMYENERPRHSWIDILYLAERLGSGPSLLPATRQGQVDCIGLSHQICGEDGLGWNRRLNIFGMLTNLAGGETAKSGLPPRLFDDYDGTEANMAASEDKLIDILTMLTGRLERQKAGGSDYLVGDSLTATDLHLATFMGMLDPLQHSDCPMDEGVRALYASGSPRLRAAVTSAIRGHRDYIYRKHLELPMDF